VEGTEPSVLTTNAAVALFLAYECFPSGDGEKYEYIFKTTKFYRNPLIPDLIEWRRGILTCNRAKINVILVTGRYIKKYNSKNIQYSLIL